MDRERIESLFHKAIEITDGDQRAAYLQTETSGESQILEQVERLIHAHEMAGGFMRRGPVTEITIDATLDSVGNQQFSVTGATHNGGSDPGQETLASDHESRVGHQPSGTTQPAKLNTAKYEVLEELARGGMGAVLKGRDLELRRELAFKVLLDQHKHKPAMVERFVEEAQIAGQLQHPGIAPVYELGNFDGDCPYFSMKLVKGRTLSVILKQRENLVDDVSNYLGIFEQVCQTVGYAHSRQVIHRDLKPANIMVGAFGEVQVMDWGLAKVLTGDSKVDDGLHTEPDSSVIHTARSDDSMNDESDTSKTRAGSMMGTPAYMPPEQAIGDQALINERADVFGLGAILCEILTGKPAYAGDGSGEILRNAIRGDLSDASKRLQDCGGDASMVQLAMRCLEHDPDQRPANAGVVAKAMEDHFAGVQERLRQTELARVAADARADEAIRRRKLYIVLAAFMLMAAAGAGFAALTFRQQREQQRGLTLSIQMEKQKTEKSLVLANEASEQRKQMLYAADIQQAGLLWRSEEFSAKRVNDLLEQYRPTESQGDFKSKEKDLRGFEWYLCKSRLAKSATLIQTNSLASGIRDDDTLCILNTAGRIQHYDVASGQLKKVVSLKQPKSAKLSNPVLSNDATVGAVIMRKEQAPKRSVLVFNCNTGQPIRELDASSLETTAYLKFSPNNKILFCCAGKRKKNGLWWDVDSGESIRIAVKPTSPMLREYAFVPKANAVARITGKLKTSITITQYGTDEEKHPVTLPVTYPGTGTSLRSIALSPGGKWLAASTRLQGVLAIYQTDGNAASEPIVCHRTAINQITFSPDEQRIATAGSDGTIIVWRLEEKCAPVTVDGDSTKGFTLTRVSTLRAHTRPLTSLQFSSTGQYLVSRDPSEVRVWNLAKSASTRETINGESGLSAAIDFSPDGKWLFVANGTSNQVTLYDATTGTSAWSKDTELEGTTSAAFSSDSQQIAVGHRGGAITIWNVQSQSRIATLKAGGDRYATLSLAFSSDGKRLAAGYGPFAGHQTSVTRRPDCWNLETQQQTFVLSNHKNACTGIDFDIDGRRIITTSHDGFLRRFDASNGNLLDSKDTKASLTGLQVVRGKAPYLLVCANNGMTTKRRFRDLNVVSQFVGHVADIYAMALSPDGLTMATCGEDLTLRLWSMNTGREMMRVSADRVYRSLAFSPDGMQLIAGRGLRALAGIADVWRVHETPPKQPAMFDQDSD